MFAGIFPRVMHADDLNHSRRTRRGLSGWRKCGTGAHESLHLSFPPSHSFQGSDDDLRSKFEEYICSALSTIKYSDFVASGQGNEAVMLGMPGGQRETRRHRFDGLLSLTPSRCRYATALKPDPTAFLYPFSETWLNVFRQTSACKVWEASTDPLLFDICEPR
jgi:hypothetical protein